MTDSVPDSSLPLEGIPNSVLARLPGLVGRPASVYLLLEEDEYETRFGDGRFLYPRAAFWDEPAAAACLDRLVREDAERRKANPSSTGSSYHLKAVEIARDDAQRRIVAVLRQAPEEHYSVADVVRLLSAAR